MKCMLAEKGCGGCENLQKMYGDVLREKGAAFRKLFPEAENIVGMENPRYYRNKALRTFANGRESLYAGFYKAGTHQVLSVKRCLLEDKRLGQIADIAVEMLAAMRLPAYREDFGKGILRHMQLRRAHESSQVLVTIVTGSENFPGGEEFAQKLMKKCPEIRGVTQSVNDRRTSAVMGFKHKVLAGRDEIWDTLCGLKVCLTSRTFYQINSVQAEKLYSRAIEWAQLTKDDEVLDAYCGVGLIGQLAAKEAGHVTGVEIVKPSVECARASARVNRIENIDFLCADAPKALEDGKIKPTVVMVDPPRAGCERKFLQAVAHAAPGRIVYISCNPETLRRDVDMLEKSGYTLERVQPFDLFPYTPHTEAVALLSRRNTVHNMKLHSSPFEMIKSGNKTIELRLFDEKRQQIKAGDRIVFTNTATGETLHTTVVKLHRFNSFEELYKSLPLLECGYTTEDIDKANPSDMERYYSVEEQKKYGVVGIELCRPKQIIDEAVCLLTKLNTK